ncbi:type IV pilin [Halorientalis litorea]|jgi:flagellin-like protein|uniref:type IV pilin n=1 Tax=Halorientalis litorea TaxID=2931977 RepID=UPI001FF5491A|nr:type IV pilin [Halorientalis litorea]
MATRAQSETVGVVLLVAVVVTLVGLVSAVALSDIGGDEGPLADLDVSANETNLTVEHRGGDDLAVGDLAIVLRSSSESRRVTVDRINLTDRNGDGQFGLGDRIVRAHGLDGDSANVAVVHTPSNTVLLDEAVSLRDPDF